jgi:DNA polymerase I-like protein with 3'-5' exonuclease and polymerase domains
MYKRKRMAVVDIETNLAWNHIWCAGVVHESGEHVLATTPDQLMDALAGVDTIIMHNGIGFDMPRLKEVWGFVWNRSVVDTCVWSRLLEPSLDGGHSLKNIASLAGEQLKDDFDAAEFDHGLTDRMADYCIQDCRATWSVYNYLESKHQRLGFSDASLENEQEVRRLTTQQEENGFMFDFPRGCDMYNQHEERMNEIESKLQEVFPPIVERRWSEKTGKPLKDKVTVFNPGSRQQVASRLEGKGAVWKTRTETGKPKVDETTLAELTAIPEAALVLEYLTLSKRLGMLRSWIDAVAEDGRIHGRVNTCGAVTNRMTHSKPNLAQIPSDKEYRECFTVPDGYKLVGVDASGLELRMLAHYMRDDQYTDTILNGRKEDGTDIHQLNMKAAGLTSRDQAKTFIYAFLYGAGNEKIGNIVGGGERKGGQLKKAFLSSTPALAKLIEKVQRIAGRDGVLPGLDGRKIHVRSQHAALNTLLQSAGAIVMKYALVIASKELDSEGTPYRLVAQVHDEFQIEVPERYAERVGEVFTNAIVKAGEALDMRCPLAGDMNLGSSWADTH